MNQELFIIEMLSAKNQIIAQDKQNTRKKIKIYLTALITCGIVFFGISTVVYRFLKPQIQSLFYSQRLTHLYYLALLIGGVSLLFITISLISSIARSWYLRHRFENWLEKNAPAILAYTSIYQDQTYYYLAQKAGQKPKLRLKKTDTVQLLETLDGYPIMLGHHLGFAGFSTSQIFLLQKEPEKLPANRQYFFNKQLIWYGGSAIILLLGMTGVYHYAFHEPTAGEFTTPSTSHMHGASMMQKPSHHDSNQTSAGLVEQQGKTPDMTVSQTTKLYLDSSDELYMTTDSGKNWSFVPLKPDWLRSGDYTLTSGTIPVGYWMDKSYDLSKDFSWFIYSQDEKHLYLLISKDNGKTWSKSLVSDDAERIRYRKANFFADGSGVLVYTTETVMSPENLEIYITNDFGQTWSKSGYTTISKPVQNVSFVTQLLGFAATRDQLFYTDNGGRSFKEAVVSIPEDYETNGLDLFQSPNEVTQVSETLLEAKFYLLKTGDIDRGKMFACLFQSSDNGETWHFSKQLSEVEPN